MSALNSRQLNAIPLNAPGAAVAAVIPFSIDEQTFDTTWEDDQTFALEATSMTYTGAVLKPIVRGDDRRVIINLSSTPTGHTVTKAWLTIKRKAADLDAAALIQKEITSVLSAEGEITDEISDSGTLAMYFELLNTETGVAAIKANKTYYFDCQLLLSNGKIHTAVSGTVRFLPSYTDATS